ncbi:hypothetical protein CC86DRAFT_358811 [Ophiobolus disseminans]|uniref:Uncharacterized protein n=1 Tax=Ophiobolus disseminans TaxID=1469910 RepID=A0A6A6ZNE8_9PLEO|nr:hypothetical protein CC86DRAFT_358811 [Ophiobolus disseminans]
MVVKSSQSLGDLPTELIDQIMSCIDLYRNERILGHIPDDPPPNSPDTYLLTDFLVCSRALYSLALTNRRFRDIAQKYLFAAPVIGGYAVRVSGTSCSSRIAFLLRTLFSRSDLRRHVRKIRLCFLEGRPPTSGNPFDLDQGNELGLTSKPLNFATIVHQTRGIVMSSNLPETLKRTWCAQLIMDFRYSTIGILVALLPRLETLSISEQNLEPIDDIDDYTANMIGIRRLHTADPTGVDLQGIQCLPAAHSLRTLKISSMFPLRFDGLDKFPNLDTLDLGLKLASVDYYMVEELEELFATPEVTTNFDRIRHLRLDCQVKTVGIWDFAARQGIAHVLRAFSSLVSLDFYAEPSHEKNPFRSVRAFPHYQANIQTYPDEPSPRDRDATQDIFWDERVYEARTEWTNHQYLVDSLIRIRPSLQSLKLPGGFWTLPGAMRKPLPSFTSFPSLQRLDLPQAAMLSIKLDNMRFLETEHGDFRLLPTTVLPPTLQELRIFDADANLLHSEWLRQLFNEHATRKTWPDLQKLEIIFGPTFNNVELADLLARRACEQFRMLSDKAAFQVLLRRDEEVPSICL